MSRTTGLQADVPTTRTTGGCTTDGRRTDDRTAVVRATGGRRTRRVLAAAVAALAAVALTACAAIPTGGAVRTGQPVTGQEPSGVDFRPNGPTPGSDQEEVLRQFIDAATGAQDNYAVAREFLSDGFAQQWNPRQSVTIRQGDGDVERAGRAELTYTLTASATVDANGEYRQAVRPTSSTLSFQFVRQAGEWRIDYAPDGIIMTSPSFDSVFQAHALYFYDPTYDYLVPDERWFLARSSVSTRIASALLAGPSPWLKGAVVSAFPEGTQLSLNAVTIESGSAQVDLSSDALKASTTDKVRMREQLTTSMSSVATVSSVDITVEGASLAVPDNTGTSAQRDPDVDPRPLVLSKGKVGYAPLGGQLAGLGSIGDTVAALDPTSMTVTASGNEAAVGADDGNWAVWDDGKKVRVDARGDLAPPSVDSVDGTTFVWSGLRSDTRSIRAYSLTGEAHDVASTLPPGRLVSFQVSRDSTRALALIRTADGAALYVMSIIRDSQHVPTAFGSPVRVQAADGTPVSATWEDALDVASVGQTSDGSQVVTTTIGGQSETLPKPDGRVTTVVGGVGGTLLLRTSDGTVLQQTNGGWDTSGITASVLATQR